MNLNVLQMMLTVGLVLGTLEVIVLCLTMNLGWEVVLQTHHVLHLLLVVYDQVTKQPVLHKTIITEEIVLGIQDQIVPPSIVMKQDVVVRQVVIYLVIVVALVSMTKVLVTA